ncbi:MAG: hypothetical protein V1850_06800 [Candidatus Bathyarchaeota archaeon]
MAQRKIKKQPITLKGSPVEEENKKADAAYIESGVEVVATPIEKKLDKTAIEALDTARWILDGWQNACTWFDANKRAEFCYAEDVSTCNVYTSWKTLSQVVQPDTENSLRALVAKDIVSIFMKKPFAQVAGVDYKDYPQATEVNKGIKVLFDKMPEMLTEMVDFIYQRRLYGTAIGKVIWRDIYRNVTVVEDTVDELTGETNAEKSTKKVLVYSGPMVQCVDVKEAFRVDPSATKLSGHWKYHKFQASYQSLKDGAKSKRYMNVGSLTPKKLVKNKLNKEEAFIKHESGAENFMDEDLVECIEAWSPDDKRFVIAVGEKPILLVDGNKTQNPNPYGRHPFFYATINKPPKKFYGRGVPEVCRPYQEWLDIICNVINDVSIQNAAPMFSDPNNEYPHGTIPYIPWGVVHAAVTPFIKPTLPGEVFNLRNELKQSIESASTASRISSSVGALMQSQLNMKATVYAGTKATQNEGHAFDLFMLDDLGLVEMVRRCVWLMVHCMPDDVWQKMTGNTKPAISWRSLPLDLDFEATLGIDTLSDQLVQQNLMYILTQIVPVAAKVGVGVDLVELVKVAFEVANLDPDRFIKKLAQPTAAAPPEQPPVAGAEPTAETQIKTDFGW